jgi:hypothetical protein
VKIAERTRLEQMVTCSSLYEEGYRLEVIDQMLKVEESILFL